MGPRRIFQALLAAAALGAIATAVVVDVTDALRRAELATVDARFAVRGDEAVPRDIVFVAIDEASIHAHPWPMPRRLHAQVIDRLRAAGAKTIAYDVQFTEPSGSVADDDRLIEAVRRAGDVILATTAVAPDGRTAIFGGGEALRFSRAIPAASLLPNDPGGVIRRFGAQVDGLRSFALAAAEHQAGRPIAFPGGPRATAWIDFAGPPGRIDTISFQRVLEGRIGPGLLDGKLVVVGASAPTLHDRHPTSTTGTTEMPGAEIQAMAAETALRGFPLRGGPRWATVLAILALGLVVPLAALRLPAWAALGVALAAGALYAVVAALVFDAGTILAVVPPLLALGLSTAATILAAAVTSAFERERLRETFARFVPEAVVGEVLRRSDGARLGGTRREATVLFSDLRGFTAFSEGREPDVVIEVLNRYLTAMSDAILDHGGTVVSYLGDGIMAVFGAPLEQPDHADRALAAARDMLARMEGFNAWLRADGHGDGLCMGIGLNSGWVMSGNVGSRRRLEYTAIGDTTNTAARIEAMTRETGHPLLLADATHRALRSDRDGLVAVGELEVRGRRGPIALWGLVSPR